MIYAFHSSSSIKILQTLTHDGILRVLDVRFGLDCNIHCGFDKVQDNELLCGSSSG